jgi:hypothetical protein
MASLSPSVVHGQLPVNSPENAVMLVRYGERALMSHGVAVFFDQGFQHYLFAGLNYADNEAIWFLIADLHLAM